jgi:hypothetical protein
MGQTARWAETSHLHRTSLLRIWLSNFPATGAGIQELVKLLNTLTAVQSGGYKAGAKSSAAMTFVRACVLSLDGPRSDFTFES